MMSSDTLLQLQKLANAVKLEADLTTNALNEMLRAKENHLAAADKHLKAGEAMRAFIAKEFGVRL